MPSWLSTILGVIAGGALTMLSAWVADNRLSERERERRREERHERLEARRKDFQRDTLLALQVATQKLMRVAGAMHHQDVMAFRKTGVWQKQSLGEELSNEHLRQTTETMLLASRVLDGETREFANEFRKLASTVSICASEDEAENRLKAAADMQGILIERIGQLVRGMDEPC